MRTLSRLLAILIAVPLIQAGLLGLSVQFIAEEKRPAVQERLLDKLPEAVRGRAEGLMGLPLLVHCAFLGVGAAALLIAFGPAGSGGKRKPAKGQSGGKKSAQSAPATSIATVNLSKKEMKRARKLAQAVESNHGPEAAGDFLLDEGLFDDAAAIFERAGLLARVAEVLQDQNRFEEAAQTYEKADRWESAGSIYQRLESHDDAGRCYVKAGKLSVAGEMFERADNHREAGRCYQEIGFHRHAAQAFLKGSCDAEAAQSLVEAFNEEGGANTANEEKHRELRGLATKAAELFFKLERYEEAESILVRATAFAQAAKVAFHIGAYDRASELFLRVGRGDLAAKALEKMDDPSAAARALGEYLRDKGEIEEAVPHLEKAGEYQEAGDLYRQLDRFEEAGDCYTKMGDHAAAAEMFSGAEQPMRAAQAYEQASNFKEAARCMGLAGEPLRQAQLLERAGEHFTAGRGYLEQGQLDEAIRVLQLVEHGEPEFAEVCAVLGGLFQQKGQHGLSVKKFEEATRDQAVSRENVPAYFSLAQAYEKSSDLRHAVEIYEKILVFDYHYQDVAERIEQLREQAESQAPSTDGQVRTPTDRYQVVREIGRGGMGVVYLARDSVLERDVAYKVLPEQLRANPNALKNFLREAKSAAQLNHPNIVTVYDAGESEHGFYLTMELIEGTTLKEIVQRRGAVSANGVIYIMRQMADALAYAHSRKVVHRDIKTANTMWTPARQVKIMDFGLAKVMEEVRNATTVVSGTPFYMSPEQTLGRNVDHRTDIYSLGVTLFELATGELPFRRGNVPYHHVHTPPPEPRSINADVPEGLERVLLRCLAKAPEERYQTAKELLEEVNTLSAAAASG